MYRSIKNHIPAFKVNMGGMLIDQALPSASLDQIDPFLLLHHAKNYMEPGGHPRDHGVGPHPHRGFSPVTFVLQGEVRHQDSRGNISEVGAGGVQWMHSGMGIIHSERPSEKFLEQGGYFEIVQLWINSPQAHKMDQPVYQALQSEDIPVHNTESGSVVKVVAGKYSGVKSSMKTLTPMDVLDINLKMKDSIEVNADANYNSFVYIIEGGVRINDSKTYFTKDLVSFNHDSDLIKLEATADARILYLAGEALNEPKASHGPFVMNNQTEIMEALRDYQIGKMGMLVEEF
ncbi:MAG: pirin family protein [Bacteroidia bacterium]